MRSHETRGRGVEPLSPRRKAVELGATGLAIVVAGVVIGTGMMALAMYLQSRGVHIPPFQQDPFSPFGR